MTLLLAILIHTDELPDLKFRMKEAAKRLKVEQTKEVPFLSKECTVALLKLKKRRK